jgi:hypothetical protein
MSAKCGQKAPQTRKTALWMMLCATEMDPINRNGFMTLMEIVSVWGISAAC